MFFSTIKRYIKKFYASTFSDYTEQCTQKKKVLYVQCCCFAIKPLTNSYLHGCFNFLLSTIIRT